jgi:hypothetical protein
MQCKSNVIVLADLFLLLVSIIFSDDGTEPNLKESSEEAAKVKMPIGWIPLDNQTLL